MKASKRLIDPVHFFTTEGVSVLTMKVLEARNTVLEAQVKRLTRLLRSQVARNKATMEIHETPKLHS